MLRNYVVESAPAPGQGAVQLAGATPGRMAWSAFPSGSSVFYFVTDGIQTEWGHGIYTAGTPNTITRSFVSGNTANTQAYLNFTLPVKVYCEIPAAYAIYKDINGNILMGGGVIYGLSNGFADDHAVAMRQITGIVKLNSSNNLILPGRLITTSDAQFGYGSIHDLGDGSPHGQIRLRFGNRSIIFRKDANDLYILTTTGNSADNGGQGNPDGIWGPQRPFRIELGAGRVVMENGLLVQPGMEVTRFDGSATNLIISNTASSAYASINASIGNQRFIRFQRSGANEWTMGAAETTGGNFVLQRFNDAGAFIDNAIEVIRATGEFRHYTTLRTFGNAILGGYTEINNNRANFGNGSAATLTVTSTNGAAANIEYHLPGLFATKSGVTASGYYSIGGWSWAADRWRLDGSGNSVQPGAATASELMSTGAVLAGPDRSQYFSHTAQMNTWADSVDGWAYTFQRSTGIRQWQGPNGAVQMTLSADGVLDARGGMIGRRLTDLVAGPKFSIFWNGSDAQLFINQEFVGNLQRTSDYRLKRDIEPLQNSRAALMALRPVSYGWRSEGIRQDDGLLRLGFIAHEVQNAIPSAATGTKDDVGPKGEIIPQAINTLPILAVLTQQLQAALLRIDEQNRRIVLLEKGVFGGLRS